MNSKHIEKLNESIGILDKLIGVKDPNTAKAIKALAQIQHRICLALVWTIWNMPEEEAKKEKDDWRGIFNDAVKKGRR